MKVFSLWECQKAISHGRKLLGAYFKPYFDWKNEWSTTDDEIFEKTSVNTPANTSVNTPVNTSVNTPVNTSVNAPVNAPVTTSGNTSVNYEILIRFGSKSRLPHKFNLFWIWQIQKLEQVHPVSVPTLAASETINVLFKNMIYCKKLNICMRPWIRMYPISWTFPPGGRLNYEAYNVQQFTNM